MRLCFTPFKNGPVHQHAVQVTGLPSVEMLFKFVSPLVEEGADTQADDLDEEVKGGGGLWGHWNVVAAIQVQCL